MGFSKDERNTHLLDEATKHLAKSIQFVLRSSLHGCNSHNSHSHEASLHLAEFLKNIKQIDGGFYPHAISDALIDHFDANPRDRSSPPDSRLEYDAVRLAQAGARYLIELSCDDRAASGRQSKALNILASQASLFVSRNGHIA